MIRYAAPLIVVGIAAVVNQLLSVPMMKWLLPNSIEENQAAQGLYLANYRLAIFMTLFVQAFNYAAEPFFFRYADSKNAKDTYAQVGFAFTLVACLVFLGIMFYLDVIQLTLGSNYRQGTEVVPVLLLAFLMLGLYYNFSIWYKLSDKTHFGAYISLAGAVLTIILNVILLPRIGVMGAAWTSLACYTFMAFASFLTGKRHYPIPYPIFKMLAYIIVAVIIFSVSELLASWFSLSFYPKILLNTLLLLVYIGIVFGIEKKTLKAWRG